MVVHYPGHHVEPWACRVSVLHLVIRISVHRADFSLVPSCFRFELQSNRKFANDRRQGSPASTLFKSTASQHNNGTRLCLGGIWDLLIFCEGREKHTTEPGNFDESRGNKKNMEETKKIRREDKWRRERERRAFVRGTGGVCGIFYQKNQAAHRGRPGADNMADNFTRADGHTRSNATKNLKVLSERPREKRREEKLWL